MLKNPVHFFRKDAKMVKTTLLTGKFMRRSPEILRKLNEALAYRHLSLNNIIKSIPHDKKHPDILYPSVFNQVFLDLRIEEPSDPGYRVAINMTSKLLPAVVSSNISKRLRFYIKDIIKNKTGSQDLIITPNTASFFVSDSQLIAELELLFKKNEENFRTEQNSENASKIEELYYSLLKDAYKGNEKEFFYGFSKVSEALSDKFSPLSVGNS